MTALAPKTVGRAAAVAALALTFAALLHAAPAADGSEQTMTYKIAGPGLSKAGREVKMSVKYANRATDPAVAPALIDRALISSNSLRFNGAADGVSACAAAIPDDGNPVSCPRRSYVGRGTVTGIIGQPGQPIDLFGSLSPVEGKFKIYNYKRGRGESARMIAVIETTRPIAAFYINLVIPVSRSGVMEVDVPDVAELPSPVDTWYPAGTRLIVTGLSTDLYAPRKRKTKPFMWLRHAKRADVTVRAIGE